MSQSKLFIRGLCGLSLLCGLAACSSAPLQYHQLRAGLPGAQQLKPGAVLLVEPVSLPAGSDRPQLLLEDSQGRPQLQEQQYWTASLSQLLTQAVAGNLAQQLALSSVYAAPQLGLARADLTLQLDVREFRLRRGEGATLAAAWRLERYGQASPLLQGYFRQQQAVSSGDAAALVAAQQSLLDALSRQLATALAAHPAWWQPAQP